MREFLRGIGRDRFKQSAIASEPSAYRRRVEDVRVEIAHNPETSGYRVAIDAQIELECLSRVPLDMVFQLSKMDAGQRRIDIKNGGNEGRTTLRVGRTNAAVASRRSHADVQMPPARYPGVRRAGQ
jgi:hypothetical protein